MYSARNPEPSAHVISCPMGWNESWLDRNPVYKVSFDYQGNETNRELIGHYSKESMAVLSKAKWPEVHALMQELIE